ncbi:MAG: hypothetical protein IIC84_09210 [Chloroflexi bacterium]|nr:hypothetical protein [Chloroflexota bacterium]
MRLFLLSVVALLSMTWVACSSSDQNPGFEKSEPTPLVVHANVTGVSASGSPGSYSFQVTVESDETGCGQYADWWEVLSPDGRLIYRRILLHSHDAEQPFARSGGPVDIQPDETVIVRAHMNTVGYEGAVYRGSVNGGFKAADLPSGFADDVGRQEPQPSGCAF